MYPHVPGCPSPSYIYLGYEQYYSKDSWASASPNSWHTFYSPSSRSSEAAETAVNPKMTILPPQPILVSDIDTPSSVSSHSVLTPSSPFAHHDVREAELQSMEFDEVDFEDDDEYIDSDFADEMEGIIQEAHSPLYGASAPQLIKSTSALAGALGDVPSSSYDSDRGMLAPADRRLSASVPGYASASHRSAAACQQRWPEKAQSPAPQMSCSPHVPEVYPSQHTYTQRNYMSSTSLLAPNSPSVYNVSSSSSLAGAITPSVPSSSSHVRHTSLPLPILQPQPIRPIPPIPLADLTLSADEEGTSCSPEPSANPPSRTLSPLPLLCRPVSDAVRYQLKERPANSSSSSAMDDADICYNQPEDEPEPVECDDLIVAADSNDRFAPQEMAFCQERHHTSTTCSMAEKLYSCGCIGLPIRWQ